MTKEMTKVSILSKKAEVLFDRFKAAALATNDLLSNEELVDIALKDLVTEVSKKEEELPELPELPESPELPELPDIEEIPEEPGDFGSDDEE